MKYKDKVIQNLDVISQQLNNLANGVQKGMYSPEVVKEQLDWLSKRVEEVSNMVSLEEGLIGFNRQ